MLELYNMTSEIRRIPMFRYNGKYELQPFESVDIEDSTAYFFKPYARVGVVVRCKKVAPAVEAEKRDSDVLKSSEDLQKELKQGEQVSDNSVTHEQANAVPQLSEGVKEPVSGEIKVEQHSIDANKIYTETELENMGLNELKEIAASMNLVEAVDMKKKADVRALILSAYQKV